MSTFTNWNGPQCNGPTRDMWQELINEYKQLLDNANYVEKVPGKGLSTEDFTTALKNKLDAINQGTASKDIGNIASGSVGLVTGDAVYQHCKNFVQSVEGKGFSTNDFTDAYVQAIESIRGAATKEVALSLTDDVTKLVTVKLVTDALENYVEKEQGKALSTNDFTDDYVALLSIIDSHKINFDFKTIAASVGGSSSLGVFYVIGMLDARAGSGSVYLQYNNGKPFTATIDFAVTPGESKAALTVTTDNVPGAQGNLTNLHFLVVKGTDSESVEHSYLAVQAEEWYRMFDTTTVGAFDKIDFNVAGINILFPGDIGYKALNDAAEILYDFEYASLNNRMTQIETEMGNITGLNDVGTIHAWPLYDNNGVAINVPVGFHACDGTAVDPSLTELISIIGQDYPLVDYHIIQTQKTVKV